MKNPSRFITIKPYSQDLRQLVLTTYLVGECSQRKLAERFSVSYSFVQDLIRTYRATGAIQPKPHAGGPPVKVNPQTLPYIEQLATAHSDDTLEELCQKLFDQHGLTISVASMCRALQKVNLPRKKRRSTPQNAIAKSTGKPARTTKATSPK